MLGRRFGKVTTAVQTSNSRWKSIFHRREMLCKRTGSLEDKVGLVTSKPHDINDGLLAPASGSASGYDLLSDILRFVQLTGEFVFTTELKAGFNVSFQSRSAFLHVVQEGELSVELEGQPPFKLRTGDVLVLPHGVSYWLRDSMPLRGALEAPLMVREVGPNEATLRHGIGEERARTLSATFQFANQSHILPLLRLLPDTIHIAKDADQSAVLIRDVAQFLILETAEREPGAALMISRVIDILIIRSIRTWARSLTPREGWVGALRDARISRAVAALHQDPSRAWAVDELAAIAGMSRSRFAELFMSTVGEPPLRYLHRWRLATAADLLKRSSIAVGEVAHMVGYDSEAAFSRAYKTMYGVSPKDSRS